MSGGWKELAEIEEAKQRAARLRYVNFMIGFLMPTTRDEF